MVHWRKLSFIILLSITSVKCIPTATCEDNLKYNKFSIENFVIVEIEQRTRGEIIISSVNNLKIKLIEEFGILLFDVLKEGDLITKKKEENIIIAKRNKYVIRYEMYCEDDNSILKIDTLSR